MIKGIGIDIIEIDRISQAIKKNEGFIYRVFTLREIEIFKEKNNNSQTIAGNFAAKEAVMKALGTGLRGFKWTDIEVDRDPLGKPYVVLYQGAKELASHMKISEILLTISHSREYAVAQAIAI